MKALIVFYSLEGNTKFIAETIEKILQTEVLELKPKKEIPKEGFQKYFWGGKSVLFKEQPELINRKTNLESYDTIIIGTPIWADSYAAPINTFLKQNVIKGKKIALFACHAGGDAQKCFAKFKEELSGNEFIGEIDFIEPLKNNKEENSEKAVQWAEHLTV